MLNIYIGRKNVPDTLDVVYDIETFFVGVTLDESKYTQNVLKYIEKGKYCDSDTFEDRFGRRLNKSCLSSTSKMLLAVNRYSDLVINCSELGNNAISMLNQLSRGNILFVRPYSLIMDIESDVSINGIVCVDSVERSRVLGGLYGI